MYRLAEDAEGRISPQTLWTAPVLRQTYASPVYHDGHLYGMNGRTVFTCVDAETGEMKWRAREPGDGFSTLVGDQIVFVTKAHTLHVGPASPQGWTERARLELFPEHLSWTAPTVAGDSVFARSLGELVRVDWKSEPAARRRRGAAAVASPTLARFLEEVERAPDKAAAVDRFLAARRRRTAGRSTRPRGVPLPRAREGRRDRRRPARHPARGPAAPACPAPTSSITRPGVEPGSRVSYQFIPDFGKPVPDPRNPRRVPGAAPGDEASSLAMPGWVEPAHLAERRPRAGAAGWRTSSSRARPRPGAKTTLHVYLPAGYDGGADRYPVAYVLDGDGARAQGLRAAQPRQPHAGAGGAGDRGVPWAASTGEPWKPAPREAMDASLEMLAKEIVPLMDARFRTIAEPGARAVVGQAFDGRYGDARRPSPSPGLFGALGAAIRVPPRRRSRMALKPLFVPRPSGPCACTTTGASTATRPRARPGTCAPRTARFNEYLRSKGYQPAGGEAKDGDGWASWRNRTDQLFTALFPPPSR